MGHVFKLMLFALAILSRGQAQILTIDDLEPQARDIASDDPCAAELGVASPSDNLSCEFVVPGGTRCYFRDELCNDNNICLTGSDEGDNIAALDCTGTRAGTGFPVFECTSGENVLLSQLCDGFADCGAGDDETTPLCENKCRFPYYGGCPYTRECLTSALDVGCPRCLGGFVEDPNNLGGECFPLINITLELGTYNTAEGDGSVEVCAVLTSGMIEAGQSFTTLLETSPGSASTADFGQLIPPAVLTFTSTQSRDCANIPIVDDNIVEGPIPESFNVILSSNDFQVNIITNTAQVLIQDNDALFEFTQNTYIGSEGVGSPPDIPFAIRIAAGSIVLSQPVTVTVTSGAGSALANSDYFPVSTQITFPAGSGPLTTLGSTLDPIDDNRVESNENVQLNAIITAGAGSFTPGGDTATVVIQDNDELVIGFEPTSYQVSEADGQIEVCFQVEENNVLDIAGQAILNTQSGSAIASADFTPLINEVVDLPIGTALGSQFCRTINILQDGVPENIENFSVLLTSNSAAISVNPATSSATVNILGDRIIFAFSETNYNVNEGDGIAEVCIDLISGVLSANTPIEIIPQTGSAGVLDFTPAPQTVVFPMGSAPGERRCINIPLNDETLVEVPESFSVSADSNDPNVEFMPGSDLATVIITDNDIAEFQYTQQVYVVGESNGPAQPAIELVFGTLTFDIAVDVATVNGGSASAGLDYMNIPTQRLTFPAGSSPFDQIPFNVQILLDELVEGDETINLMANSPSNFASVNPDSATLVIDDDDLLVLQLQQTLYQVFESNDQEICFEVVSGVLSFDINPAISTTTMDGSAVASGDYVAISNIDSLLSGTGLPGNTVFCTTLVIQDDTIAEGIEDLTAQLTSLSPFIVVNPPNTATIQILDNDMVMFEFSEVTYNVDEQDISAEVCIDQVTGVTSAPITLTITTADGSARQPGDYTATSLPVTFPSGSSPPTQRCINIPINNDVLVEFTESFSVSASTNDPNAVFSAGRDSAIVNIADNDDALFEFVQNTFSGSESVGSPPDIPFSVRLAGGSGTLTQPVTIQVQSVPGGSAIANLDYVPVAVQLVFPAGSGPGATQGDALDPIDDNRVEGSESVSLLANIVAGIGMLVSGGDSASVVILDDDLLTVGIQEDSYTLLEFGGGSVDVCFEVESGILDIDVQPAVRLFTQDITANGNVDYVAVDTNINLSSGTGLPGQMMFCTPITAIDDNIAEGTETLATVISSLNGQFIAVNPARSSASVEILDDDEIILELEELTYDTAEGGLGMVMVCVNLVTGILSRSVEVDAAPKPSDPLLDSATAGADYDTFISSLIFPPGAMPGGPQARQCFNLQPFINDDILVELLESFRISVFTNDPSAQFVPGRDCATANIADNDQVTIVLVPPPGVGVPSYTTPEDTPTGSQEICVMIQGAPANILQRPVTVNLGSSDGPAGVNGAQSPADYGSINSPIIFSPGQEGQQMCREIPIFDDIICEGDELFNVALISSDSGINLNPPTSTGTVTIIDNDVATISADQIDYIVNEQDDLWITLHLDGQKGEGRECVVSVMTVDGTATDGQDYVGIAGNYVFNSTVFTQRVQLDIINDNRCEGDEDLEVFLSTNSPDCQVATPQLSVTIRDDEIGMGDDPHFSIYLPSGEMLCYTVQGEHGFAFNLINNKQLIMNAKFVPDARREEVTWLGSMGIIIQNSNYGGSNDTRLRFEAQEKTLYINDKVVLNAKNVEKLTFSNGKMTISEAAPTKGFHYPSLLVDLKDVEVSFTIKYTNQHLDMFWHSTGKKVTNSHGIIGQFFRKGVDVDTVRKILIMPNKEPVPVMRRPVWSFMERETPDDQLCWTAMNPGYQGEGLIDGTYLDYLVDDVMSTDLKFKQG